MNLCRTPPSGSEDTKGVRLRFCALFTEDGTSDLEFDKAPQECFYLSEQKG
jgi:hypothetical protein